MKEPGLFQYFVEGECEANLLSALVHAKDSKYRIHPGKIERLNPVLERISPVKAMTIKKGTTVVLVFDTDIDQDGILLENVRTLKRVACLDQRHLLFLMSVRYFEEELVFACDCVNSVKELIHLFGARGMESFKTDFCNCRNLEDKLSRFGFKRDRMWARSASKPFDRFENGGKRIWVVPKGK